MNLSGSDNCRVAVVAWARWLMKNKAGNIHYAEIRPIPLVKPIQHAFPIRTDCSGFVTLCYYLAGVKNDPNGEGWNGQGYTGTLLTHGKKIRPDQVLPGDIVVYGQYPGVHTAIVLADGIDPLTISHGEEGDPSLVHVSQDHRTPKTFLRFPMKGKIQLPPST